MGVDLSDRTLAAPRKGHFSCSLDVFPPRSPTSKGATGSDGPIDLLPEV